MLNANQHVDMDAVNELKLIMGDEFSLLIDTFVTDSNQRIEGISVAVRSGDSDTIRRAAHSFKGSAGNMAASALAELCRKLEDAAVAGNTEACYALEQQISSEYQQVKAVLESL